MMLNWFYILDTVTLWRPAALKVNCCYYTGSSVSGFHESIALIHLGVRRYAPPCGEECIYNIDPLRAAGQLIIWITKKKLAQTLILLPFRGEFKWWNWTVSHSAHCTFSWIVLHVQENTHSCYHKPQANKVCGVCRTLLESLGHSRPSISTGAVHDELL